MAKKFAIPFASTGDKAVVPDALQPDGSVSYTQGFGPDYELDRDVDPVNAKDVPRDETNQLFFDVTDAIGEIQKNGAPIWALEMAPYPINARVYYADKMWRSNIINNNGEPGASSGWDDVSSDLLNSLRIDVPSSSNINLTALAPNTRHINITGSTNITGFTIAAGQCYFVRFNAALTLTNSANLVTQTGGDIVTATGDTCIIRATAENTVELLCGDFLADKGLGYKQSWQNVAGSRVFGAAYTNTTGKPILVSVLLTATSTGNRAGIRIDGNLFDYRTEATVGAAITLSATVPAGSTYVLGDNNNAYLSAWREYR